MVTGLVSLVCPGPCADRDNRRGRDQEVAGWCTSSAQNPRKDRRTHACMIERVKVAVIGVGNDISALVQG
jgi:hypothetical protein